MDYLRWIVALSTLGIVTTLIYLTELDLAEMLLAALILIKSKALALLKYLGAKIHLFLAASKKKIWLYLKTLTLAKLLGVGIKRFIIDNYLSRWIEVNILTPLKTPISGFLRYYMALSTREKLKKALWLLLPASLLVWLMNTAGILEHLFFYAEIKALVIGFFKLLWLVSGKLIGWIYSLFTQSWLAPLLQLFALSYLLEKMQALPIIGPALRYLFEWFDALFGTLFQKISRLWERYIERHVSVRVRRRLHSLARSLEHRLEVLKHRNEIFLMKNFITLYILPGTVASYFQKHLETFLESEKCDAIDTVEAKSRFLHYLNKKTGDNIDIIAFFDIAPYPPVRDVFVLESFASGFLGGNKKHGIRADAIWLLNMQPEEIVFSTPHLTRTLKGGRIKLIQLPEQDLSTMQITTRNGDNYPAVAVQSQQPKKERS